MLKLLKNLKLKEWLMVIVSVVLIVAQVYLELKMPDYLKQLTGVLAAGTPDTIAANVGLIWENGAYMLLCAIGSAIFAIIVGFFAAKIAAKLSARIRASVFDKVSSFSLSEMKKFSTASLITRSTNDITQVQMVVAMGLQVLIKAPIMAVWAIVKILGKSWQWSAATAIAVAILFIMIIILVITVLPKFKKMQGYTDNLNRVTRENLTGIRVVHAYNAENFEQKKFEKANEDLTKTNLFTNRMMATMNPIIMLVMNGLTLAIYWIGAVVINQADFLSKIDMFGDMMVFSSYAMLVIMSFLMLTVIFIMLPRAQVSAKRINEVLGTESTIKDGNVELTNGEIVGEVEFKNVGFKYPNADEYVLKDISFKAKKGETVAFIGSTGSGKSTLINLVPRFYDATEGEVLIDGINVKDYKLNSLNNKLGYVAQKANLFTGSVKSNVGFGESKNGKPTDEDIVKAVETAQSKDFVEKMEGTYEAHISQGGKNVSGGQKQRLSIARAIAKKPEIFIFDDSFSALDYKTDKALRKALKTDLKDSTNLIVAQRIGTIKDADKIVVLDEGKMVSIGTHKELMENCNVYKEIAYSQLSKEELSND